MKFLADLILGFAGRGKWYALAIGTVLFGAQWLVGVMWPGNPLHEAFSGVEAGLVSHTTVIE